MKTYVVCGLGFGDEGKGQPGDWMTRKGEQLWAAVILIVISTGDRIILPILITTTTVILKRGVQGKTTLEARSIGIILQARANGLA